MTLLMLEPYALALGEFLLGQAFTKAGRDSTTRLLQGDRSADVLRRLGDVAQEQQVGHDLIDEMLTSTEWQQSNRALAQAEQRIRSLAASYDKASRRGSAASAQLDSAVAAIRRPGRGVAAALTTIHDSLTGEGGRRVDRSHRSVFHQVEHGLRARLAESAPTFSLAEYRSARAAYLDRHVALQILAATLLQAAADPAVVSAQGHKLADRLDRQRAVWAELELPLSRTLRVDPDAYYVLEDPRHHNVLYGAPGGIRGQGGWYELHLRPRNPGNGDEEWQFLLAPGATPDGPFVLAKRARGDRDHVGGYLRMRTGGLDCAGEATDAIQFALVPLRGDGASTEVLLYPVDAPGSPLQRRFELLSRDLVGPRWDDTQVGTLTNAWKVRPA